MSAICIPSFSFIARLLLFFPLLSRQVALPMAAPLTPRHDQNSGLGQRDLLSSHVFENHLTSLAQLGLDVPTISPKYLNPTGVLNTDAGSRLIELLEYLLLNTSASSPMDLDVG